MSDASCIFCKIVRGEIPSPRIFENDEFIAIRDIAPHAKAHYLVLPKEHLARLDEMFPAQGKSRAELVGRMFEAAVKVAREQGLLPGGFRSVINTGPDALQTVHHVHLHILGGHELGGKLG
jgi:histidine triad (HIT) family protein